MAQYPAELEQLGLLRNGRSVMITPVLAADEGPYSTSAVGCPAVRWPSGCSGRTGATSHSAASHPFPSLQGRAASELVGNIKDKFVLNRFFIKLY